MCMSPEAELDAFVAFSVLLVTRICIIISNLLIVISAWQAVWSSRTVTPLNSRGSLTSVLFRDGTFSTPISNVIVLIYMCVRYCSLCVGLFPRPRGYTIIYYYRLVVGLNAADVVVALLMRVSDIHTTIYIYSAVSV